MEAHQQEKAATGHTITDMKNVNVIDSRVREAEQEISLQNCAEDNWRRYHTDDKAPCICLRSGRDNTLLLLAQPPPRQRIQAPAKPIAQKEEQPGPDWTDRNLVIDTVQLVHNLELERQSQALE